MFPIKRSPRLDPERLRAAAGFPYLQPAGLISGALARSAIEAGTALPLAGGWLAFTRLELLSRGDEETLVHALSLPELRAMAEQAGVVSEMDAALNRLSAPRAPIAGLSLDRPRLMGVINVTPDSFSDGGWFFHAEAAIAHGRALREAGADILDIGGESTRPGADPVSAEEEAARVLPVIEALAKDGATVSIDTQHRAVMAAALDAGAALVNDVTALTGDMAALALVAERAAPVALMHMLGDPRTMQDAPHYENAALDVFDYLARRVRACVDGGVRAEDILVDPGIGFGKNDGHNLELISRLALLHGLGQPILFGASRKSMIGRLAGGEPVTERLGGSIALAIAAAERGAQIIRVHDVAETRQALALTKAVRMAE